MFSKTFRFLLPAALVAAVAASQANAAIMYGDFSDIPPGAVMYLDVTESSFTQPVPPELYGEPTVTGNLLDFDPSGFGVGSSGGDFGLTDGQISFTIMALPGAGLTDFTIVESGDFSFSGTGGADTFVSASAAATVSILEVDGEVLTSPIPVFASGVYTNDYATTGGSPSTGLMPFSLATLVDLGPYLPDGFTEGATKIDVSINNQLATGTEATSQAAIAKKDFKIVPGGDLTPDEVIPEPTSAVLALAGSLLMLGRRRNG